MTPQKMNTKTKIQEELLQKTGLEKIIGKMKAIESKTQQVLNEIFVTELEINYDKRCLDRPFIKTSFVYE
jgi:hypothetical protein